MLLTELAVAHPRLTLHALYVSGVVRAEWCRLTMPPEQRIRLEQVTGYSSGTPLLGPLPASRVRRARVGHASLARAHRRYHRAARHTRLSAMLGVEVRPADEQPERAAQPAA